MTAWRRSTPDVFAVIADDHRKILGLVDELVGEPGAARRPWRSRQTLAARLVMAESRHETAEEQYLWPAVRDALPAGHHLVFTGLAQERTAKQLLAELDRHADNPDGNDPVIRRVAEAVREHVSYEESSVLPQLRAELSDEMAQRLGHLLTRTLKVSPTRPHPHTPPIPGLLKSAGRATAIVDRVRDILTLRGH